MGLVRVSLLHCDGDWAKNIKLENIQFDNTVLQALLLAIIANKIALQENDNCLFGLSQFFLDGNCSVKKQSKTKKEKNGKNHL